MELDKDLQARQEARELARKAELAQKTLAGYPQEKLDAICKAIAEAFANAAGALAALAVEETGFGNLKDKEEKNRFASCTVWDAIRDMKTVGVLSRNEREKLWEVAVPVGVIAAIVPSTNPTSTVCYKALIALKAGNTIVFSPHPKAIKCTMKAAQLVAEAACRAGAPEGSIGCLTIPSLDGCRELMQSEPVKLILATGGPAMVKSAYSSGKPAIGVGAGNGPAYIHASADVHKAMACILRSKTFDYGTVCASEQSIIVEKSTEDAVLREGRALGFAFLNEDDAKKLGKLLFRDNGALNPAVVGKPAMILAQMAGIHVPDGTKVLVAREREAGPSVPYSREKLCPVLALYVMESQQEVLEQVVRVLVHEGSGHTFCIHASRQDVIEEFARKVPVSRLLVNTPAALGGIGSSTALFPALTLGCGAVGGSSSSDNISPMNLINIRRVAWGTEEVGQEAPAPQISGELVELLARKIMERLEG